MGPNFLFCRSANSNDNILLPLQDVIYVSTFMKVYFLHIKHLRGLYKLVKARVVIVILRYIHTYFFT